ncbi:YkvA family protein [Spirosoma aerophilum]
MKNEHADEGLFVKIQAIAKDAKKSVLYPVFVGSVVLKKPTTPIIDKVLIVSAIAYLFLRTDIIPDAIPVLGYADDIAALLCAISRVSRNISPAVEVEAQADYDDYFGERPNTLS